jgi:cytochrome c oxidase cbb3-type subunit 4
MTYEAVTHFAQTWGLVFAVALFAVAVAYALWPSNRQTFDRAAHAPLNKDDDNVLS